MRDGEEQEQAHEPAQGREEQWLEAGLGAQILRDLGVSTIRLITTTRARHYVGLSGFGIEIEDTDIFEG